MKQFILLLILHISLFSSCQNKRVADDIPYTFYLDEKNYSYKDYEIIPGTGLNLYENRIFPLAVGDSGLLLYSYFEKDYLNFVKLEGAIKKYTDKIDSSRYTYIPIFDKDLGIDNINDVIFQLKGLENRDRQVDVFHYGEESIQYALIDEKKIVYTDRTGKQKFTLTSDYKRDKDNPKYIHNISLFIQIGDKKQCFFRTPDKLHESDIYIYISGDYDEDGGGDFILRIADWNEERGYTQLYYLLYLSSEAEEGELIKHLATCTFKHTKPGDKFIIKGLD